MGSSDARRLKAEGIDVKSEINVEHWFLSGKDDVRSSFYLEDPATEFDIQGLELDWACVAWGGDFRYVNEEWEYKSFKGTKWQNINQEHQKFYKKNSYRVLLTRARQGMIIYIPRGCSKDYTRNPEYYTGTYNYLRNIGIEEIGEKYFEQLGEKVVNLSIPNKFIKKQKEEVNNLKIERYIEKKKNAKLIDPIKDTSDRNKIKVGKLVREKMNQVSRMQLLQNEDLERLLDYDYSKEIFNLNYPFIKKIDKSRNLKEQRLVNNHPRYWSEIFIFEGEEYYICSEWYENSNRKYFEKWINKLLPIVLKQY